MNKLINDELKQLLYNKGWRYDLKESIHSNRGLIVEHSLAEQRWNQGNISYIDNISIADVVMWLYEKHGIWIRVTPIPYSDNLTHWRWEHMSTNYATRNAGWKKLQDYMSPTEAYISAIEYVLNEII